jgi:hypothetical protein
MADFYILQGGQPRRVADAVPDRPVSGRPRTSTYERRQRSIEQQTTPVRQTTAQRDTQQKNSQTVTQIRQARTAGYTDDEIVARLAEVRPDIGAAVAAGYTPPEIFEHLTRIAPTGNRGYDETIQRSRSDLLAQGEQARTYNATPEAQAVAERGWVGQRVEDFREPGANALALIAEGQENEKSGNPLQYLKGQGQTILGIAGVAASPFSGAINTLTAPPSRAAARSGAGTYEGTNTLLTMATAPVGLPGGAAARATGAARGAGRAGSRNPLAGLADDVAMFERSNVDPSLAAVQGRGAATVANVVAENPLAGIPSRGRMQRQATQAGEEAGRIASGYGSSRGAQITGENVQAGVQRFARDRDTAGTFAARSEQLYERAFGPILTAEAATPGGIPATATREVLLDAAGRINSEALSGIIVDPRIPRLLTALQKTEQIGFSDLRALRTWIREAKGNQQLRQGLGQATLSRLEAALTEDIYHAADVLGAGTSAGRDLRRADEYYRVGSERIENALQPFAAAKAGESAYARVIQAAGSGSSADAQKLLSLKRSLNGEEWGDIVANVVTELGRPAAGAASAGREGFSVAQFLTNYNKLSPRARQVLFGSVGGGGENAANLAAELDNLAQVVERLKAVDRGANASNSFVNAQGGLTILGGLTDMGATATATGGMAGLGEIMTNPAVVRWLARAASRPTPTAAQMSELETLARSNSAAARLLTYVKENAAQFTAAGAVTSAATPEPR